MVELSVILAESTRDEGANICTFCPEDLDTGESLKETAPWDDIIPNIGIRVFKGNAEFPYGGKPSRE